MAIGSLAICRRNAKRPCGSCRGRDNSINVARAVISSAVLAMLGAATIASSDTLAHTSGCVECHGADTASRSPTFDDIAARYQDDPAARAALIDVVKRGGKGNWTEISRGVPMPPYGARLSNAEVERLVDWILAQ